MAIAITLMVPFYAIDRNAPFSAAFTRIPGWGWAQYLVSVGAVFGIGTVLLVRFTRVQKANLARSGPTFGVRGSLSSVLAPHCWCKIQGPVLCLMFSVLCAVGVAGQSRA